MKAQPWRLTGWLFAAALLAGAPPNVLAVDSAAEELEFPLTFEQVWYRTGEKRGWLGPKLVGDLTITDASIEVSSPKVDFTFALADLAFVSMGTMRGDPDTEWTVFSVKRERVTELVGLRDGKQLGYGPRTEQIFEAIREAARRSGVAQFQAPAGFTAYTELDHQFSMAIPRDWLSHHQQVVSVDQVPIWGTVVFSPTIPRIASGLTDRKGARKAIRRGEMTAWVVEREQARKRVICEELTDKAVPRIREWLASSTLFGGVVDPLIAGPPRNTRVDRCAGLRWTGVVPTPGGAPARVVLVVASDDRSMYAIALLAAEESFDDELPRFEQALSTFRFAVAD